MRTSEKVDTILPALMKVKATLQAVSKSANNPFFKSKYADLNTYLDEVEPHLHANGLVLLQPVSVNPLGSNVVSSIIIDKDGQFVSSEMTVVAKELDMQKLGSAITYARRYTLGALLSMKAEDDDGNSASGKTPEKVVRTTTTPSAAPIQSPTTVTAKTDTPSTPTESKLMANRPSFRDRNKNKTTPAPKVVEPQVTSNGDDL